MCHYSYTWIKFTNIFQTTPLELGQSYDCPNVRETNLKNM